MTEGAAKVGNRVLKQLEHAWNKGDGEQLADDVLYVLGRATLNAPTGPLAGEHNSHGFADVMGTEWKGRDGLLQFWRDWLGTLGGRIVVESVLDAGDRVVVVGTMDAVGETSRAPSIIRFGQVWSFGGGRVRRIDGYYDPRAALEAVGLRE